MSAWPISVWFGKRSVRLLSAAALACAQSPCAPVVAAAASGARFVIQGGEALDTTTGLTWSRCSVGQRWRANVGCAGATGKFSFAEAQIQANAHWRLPTAAELAGLCTATGRTRANGARHYIDEDAFPPSAEENAYWSSSGLTPVDGVAVTFFDDHPAFVTSRLDLYAVRLVRRKSP
jgi:Protein of unknown function (DUF1566)